MRPLEIGLHSASLLACAALGAGFWTLKQEPPPAPATRVPSAAAPIPVADDGKVRTLEREVESLRLRLKDLEASRGSAPLAQVQPSGTPAPAASSASLLAALDDPKVQEKLRKVSGIEMFNGDQGMADLPFVMQAANDQGDIFHGMDLNPMQKDLLGTILKESGQQIGELFQKVGKKELTNDQALSQLERSRTDADARAHAVLTEAQFKDYQERLKDMREMTTEALKGQGTSLGIARSSIVIPMPGATPP